jgi:tetratricopeptide (TPR) repeat protein
VAEWEGFTDLYQWVRWNANPDPARRVASEQDLVDRVGQWITTTLLGPSVVAAIAGHAPTTVRVQVPDPLGYLRLRPLELAHHGGRALAADGQTTFVYQLTATAPTPQQTGAVQQGRLRMVAVFSQPHGASMLALRRERYELTRLVRRLAATSRRAIDLEVLQYGVTRHILAERIEADGGCDLLHISAHGGADVLLLEHPDGSPDPVSTDDLIKLLQPVKAQVKLAVVSACESAAATIAETLHWLHIDTTTGSADADTNTDPPAEAPVAGLARRLGVELGCAVVAMRYPVLDEFAIALAEQLYRNLFQQRLPLATATRRAVATTMRASPTPARPPVSMVTPALLTPAPHRADVRFDPPTGTPNLADLRLVGFPDEPERFVGRAAAMARATTALAPASATTGVLLHGMAGAGKTACALELAYRHRDRFAEAVFWQAPTNEDQWPNALPDLAITLDQRLGIGMVDRIGSAETLQAFLPHLRRLLTEHGLLLVLDNLETLLTATGQWRDPRWAALAAALTAHSGESRVVLTSRTRPADLDPRVIVLPVHALSRDETVLLARELPNLNALLHADGSPTRIPTTTSQPSADQVERDRALVRRTLTVVQGHPKLLELVDAAATDPHQLETHLDTAEQAAASAGGGGLARLAAFLTTGDSNLDPDGFYTVLNGWTTATVQTLPEPARLLLQTLCVIEDDDRQTVVLTNVWPPIWNDLHPDTDTPDLNDAIQTLADAALVHAEPHPPTHQTSTNNETEPAASDGGDGVLVRYRIHPGVADAVHATTPDPTVTTVRKELAGFWHTVFTHASTGAPPTDDSDADGDSDGVEQTGLVVHAGLAAAPYLTALGDHDTAARLLEQATVRDASPAVTHTALPHLRRIAEASGRPDHIGILARVLALVDRDQAAQLLRTALHEAATAGDHRLASGIAGELVTLLQQAGRLREALDLTDTKAGHTRQAGLGPWTQLADHARRLQTLRRMGQHEQVLAAVTDLRAQIAGLPTQRGDNETVNPFNVGETLANLGVLAAIELGRWQDALGHAHDQVTSLRARGAGDHDIARARFNTYRPLLALGHLQQADNLLHECQHTFETHHDLTNLARTLGARAQLAAARGHHHDAARLEHAALRLAYQQPQPRDIAAGHHNLGNYLTATGADATSALAHLLADILIDHLIGDTTFIHRSLQTIAAHLHSHPHLTPPTTLADLAAVTDHDGVRYQQLIHTLTGGDTPLADQALIEIIDAARTLPTARAPHTGQPANRSDVGSDEVE